MEPLRDRSGELGQRRLMVVGAGLQWSRCVIAAERRATLAARGIRVPRFNGAAA